MVQRTLTFRFSDMYSSPFQVQWYPNICCRLCQDCGKLVKIVEFYYMVKKHGKSDKNIEIGTLIENFDDKITFIAEQVVAIKETQDLHSQKFDKIDNKLDRVEMRLDGIETKLDKKADKEDVKKLSQRVIALEI